MCVWIILEQILKIKHAFRNYKDVTVATGLQNTKKAAFPSALTGLITACHKHRHARMQ